MNSENPKHRLSDINSPVRYGLRGKLQECKYFLELIQRHGQPLPVAEMRKKLKNDEMNSGEYLAWVGSHDRLFSFNVSAFLSASNSVFDYVLEYANLKFNLELGEKYDFTDFKNKIYHSNNNAARLFLVFQNQMYAKIKGGKYGEIFITARNNNTHHDLPLRLKGEITTTGGLSIGVDTMIIVEGLDKESVYTSVSGWYSQIFTYG